mmetsp:Transcript_6540/g.10727  ORF Transcript_6540/g.10727 Transcript_6540/m.10727 type:complete len:211 (-) Transcript_6540:571-1203(-)
MAPSTRLHTTSLWETALQCPRPTACSVALTPILVLAPSPLRCFGRWLQPLTLLCPSCSDRSPPALLRPWCKPNAACAPPKSASALRSSTTSPTTAALVSAPTSTPPPSTPTSWSSVSTVMTASPSPLCGTMRSMERAGDQATCSFRLISWAASTRSSSPRRAPIPSSSTATPATSPLIRGCVMESQTMEERRRSRRRCWTTGRASRRPRT